MNGVEYSISSVGEKHEIEFEVEVEVGRPDNETRRDETSIETGCRHSFRLALVRLAPDIR